MATVNDYTTGRVLEDTKLALLLLKFINIPTLGKLIGKILISRTEKHKPKLLNIEKATELIQNSKKCAVGERICRTIHQNSEFTESVFLDELADELDRVGKAKYVTKEEAINTLKKYPKNPLILSKVSGEYIEICRSLPIKCVYWRMEKCGIRCLNQ